jgi:hypothetical protein
MARSRARAPAGSLPRNWRRVQPGPGRDACQRHRIDFEGATNLLRVRRTAGGSGSSALLCNYVTIDQMTYTSRTILATLHTSLPGIGKSGARLLSYDDNKTRAVKSSPQSLESN